jgi:hypothetical protein
MVKNISNGRNDVGQKIPNYSYKYLSTDSRMYMVDCFTNQLPTFSPLVET